MSMSIRSSVGDVLKMFDSSTYPFEDQGIEHCPKCGKVFRRVSIEGVPYKICACNKIPEE